MQEEAAPRESPLRQGQPVEIDPGRGHGSFFISTVPDEPMGSAGIRARG